MKKRSFTLIEILVSITIVVLFSGITLAYYNNFTEDQKLKSESKRLISVLALARKSASSGLSIDVIDPTATCDISNGYIFDGYKVVISNTNYELWRVCSLCDNESCTSKTSSDALVKTYNFDKDITVKTGGEFLFQPLSLGVKVPLLQSSIITVKNKLEKCIHITVGASTIDESEITIDGC